MNIVSGTYNDIETIFKLYNDGTEYQKTVAKKHWKGFERSVIQTEIAEKKHWKILVDEQVACIFAITFSDPYIWQEKNKDPAIYIHRIVTNPAFRGKCFVKIIIEWAKAYAGQHSKLFIRMDTGSGNEKLNNYYVKCGFNYLGIIEIKNAEDLPKHYIGGSSSLFEIRL